MQGSRPSVLPMKFQLGANQPSGRFVRTYRPPIATHSNGCNTTTDRPSALMCSERSVRFPDRIVGSSQDSRYTDMRSCAQRLSPYFGLGVDDGWHFASLCVMRAQSFSAANK